MSRYHKEKALQATINKIDTLKKETNFFVKNVWKVAGFGIFVSFWAPIFKPSHGIYHRKSAIEVSDLSYPEIVIMTAFLYIIACILGHFIWKLQDKIKLQKLLERKKQLETELRTNNISI